MEKNFHLVSKRLPRGNLHPITKISTKVIETLQLLGFQLVEGPEVETVENNFDVLEVPRDHPARSRADTFYFDDRRLLRTHTTNAQARFLKEFAGQELKIISTGKVYRRDVYDFTHTPQFTQLDCVWVEKGVSFADLKGILDFFLKNLFGEEVVYRLRPSFFPFTTPSTEVDVQCRSCKGKGCSTCKKEGWVEVLGAGLINPRILDNCGYDSKVYSGLAMGMGIERLLMIKYGINDVRAIYSNDLRFLRQFYDL